jgi:hypothetical protein
MPQKKGYKQTEEHKHKISQAMAGKKYPYKARKPLSEETKRKIGSANKGKVRSDDFKKRVSEKLKGKKQYEMTDAIKNKISISRKETGFEYLHLPETRKMFSDKRKGENGPNYRGGITPINHILRNNFEYRL